MLKKKHPKKEKRNETHHWIYLVRYACSAYQSG
jgi:hypothetical protein